MRNAITFFIVHGLLQTQDDFGLLGLMGFHHYAIIFSLKTGVFSNGLSAGYHQRPVDLDIFLHQLLH